MRGKSAVIVGHVLRDSFWSPRSIFVCCYFYPRSVEHREEEIWQTQEQRAAVWVPQQRRVGQGEDNGRRLTCRHLPPPCTAVLHKLWPTNEASGAPGGCVAWLAGFFYRLPRAQPQSAQRRRDGVRRSARGRGGGEGSSLNLQRSRPWPQASASAPAPHTPPNF